MGWSKGGWNGGWTSPSAAVAFLARTSGLSGTERSAYTAMINGMVSDGTWARLDALYIFATNTTTTANLNLINTNFGLTKTGTVTFTADVGYTGDGSTGFLDTAFNPSSAVGNFSLNSASLGVAVQTNDTSSVAMLEIGVTQGGSNSVLGSNFSLTSIYALNESAFNQPVSTTSKGMWAVSRTGASAESLYSNGSSTPVNTVATTVNSLANDTLHICHRNNGGNFSTRQISAAWIGGGLTGAQFASVSSRINTYLTALGVNVY